MLLPALAAAGTLQRCVQRAGGCHWVVSSAESGENPVNASAFT